jgi:hypothetical protein
MSDVFPVMVYTFCFASLHFTQNDLATFGGNFK